MISLLVTLVIIGVVLYLLETLPMDGTIKTIIKVVVVLFACLWLLSAFGVVDMPVTRIR